MQTYPTGARVVMPDATNTTTTLYVGMVVGGACSSSTDVCNSCDGTPFDVNNGFRACNLAGVSPSTVVTLVANTDALGSNTTPVLRMTGTSGTGTGAVVQTTALNLNGNTLTATTTWAFICNAAGVGLTCGQSFTGTLSFGVGTNTTDAPTEKADMSVIFGVVDPATHSLSTACHVDETSPVDGVAGEGFCEFTAYPGDAKVYADNMSIANNQVTSTVNTKYNGVVFYYVPYEGFASEQQALASITNNAASTTITYDNAVTPPEVDSRILGLENDKKYCFIMANQDEVGNIYYGTHVSSYPVGGVQPAQLCATPSEVIGLLDDKKCFIATAAFGSPFEPHVQKLRQFRDVYLKSNAAGRAFVEFYYSVSPPIAKWIKDKPLIKTAVRGALWPLYAMAEIMIRFGALETLLIALGLIAVTYSLRRRALARKELR